MTVPKDLLLKFFRKATKCLAECKTDGPLSLAEVRALLLSNQSSCLDEVVNEYNGPTSAEVHRELKHLQGKQLEPSVKEAVEEMNDTARLAFCRLVLYSECLRETSQSKEEKMQLKTSGAMMRDDLLEFFGLCNAAVRLPNVQKHLITGDPLFPDIELPAAPVFPQKRLEFVQRLILQALGYDPKHATNEIKRIFFTPKDNEYSSDKELIDIFASFASNMDVTVTNANFQATQSTFSDYDQGGSTRVVAVNYSEKIIDESGEVVSSDVPSSHAMEQQSEDRQREQLHLAKETAKLHQEILGELLSMNKEERDVKLRKAKAASEDFLRRVTEIPLGPERISFLQSIDPQTQRLLVMEKLWSSMLESNGGVPPTMQDQGNE